MKMKFNDGELEFLDKYKSLVETYPDSFLKDQATFYNKCSRRLLTLIHYYKFGAEGFYRKEGRVTINGEVIRFTVDLVPIINTQFIYNNGWSFNLKSPRSDKEDTLFKFLKHNKGFAQTDFPEDIALDLAYNSQYVKFKRT